MKPHLELLDKLGACAEAQVFAHTVPDLETAWNTCKRPDWMIWLLNKLRFQDDQTYRLYACRCVRDTPLADGRRVWDLLTDQRSRTAVEVAEKFANGNATQNEMAAARAAAGDAAWAARAAVWDAARAVWAAARAAAGDAAWAAGAAAGAAGAAAGAAGAAAWDATWDAAWAAGAAAGAAGAVARAAAGDAAGAAAGAAGAAAWDATWDTAGAIARAAARAAAWAAARAAAANFLRELVPWDTVKTLVDNYQKMEQ